MRGHIEEGWVSLISTEGNVLFELVSKLRAGTPAHALTLDETFVQAARETLQQRSCDDQALAVVVHDHLHSTTKGNRSYSFCLTRNE